MSYSIQQSRKRLPVQLLAALIAALVVWWIPFRSIATNFELWFLAPLWILLAHLATAFSYVITSMRLRPAWSLLMGSVAVYGSLASATHLAAALLVALVEETLFRLALLPWMAQWFGPVAAVVLVSAVFSLMHARPGKAGRSWAAHIDYFLFGLLVGAVTLATKSLLPALVLHTWRNYILRCLLVSRDEYAQLKRDAQAKDAAATGGW